MARFAGLVRLLAALGWLGLAAACGGTGNGETDAPAEALEEADVTEVNEELADAEVAPEADAHAEVEAVADAEADVEAAPEAEPGDETDATGEPGPEVTPPAKVAFNEVVARAVNLGADWLEIVNLGVTAADLSGWVIKDDNDAHSFTLPEGTTVDPGAYLLVEGEGGTGPLVLAFGFGKADSARLFDADGALVDTTTWMEFGAPLGGSWGRFPDGTGAFTTLATPTPGAANTDQ